MSRRLPRRTTRQPSARASPRDLHFENPSSGPSTKSDEAMKATLTHRIRSLFGAGARLPAVRHRGCGSGGSSAPTDGGSVIGGPATRAEGSAGGARGGTAAQCGAEPAMATGTAATVQATARSGGTRRYRGAVGDATVTGTADSGGSGGGMAAPAARAPPARSTLPGRCASCGYDRST